jgi:hypothetical protein
VDRRRAVSTSEDGLRSAFDELPAGARAWTSTASSSFRAVLAGDRGHEGGVPNTDTTFHNVFSLARVKTFDLGRYAPHRTGWVTFDRPGIVPVFCDIHSNMSAYILVFNHPFFALTEPDGRYSIPGVPAGAYTLRVWSELGTVEPGALWSPMVRSWR